MVPFAFLFVFALALLDIGDWRRIPAGISALISFESNEDYRGADERIEQILFAWSREHLTIFGNGLEAYRFDTGATGHSLLSDGIYNFWTAGCLIICRMARNRCNPALEFKRLLFGTHRWTIVNLWHKQCVFTLWITSCIGQLIWSIAQAGRSNP